MVSPVRSEDSIGNRQVPNGEMSLIWTGERDSVPRGSLQVGARARGVLGLGGASVREVGELVLAGRGAGILAGTLSAGSSASDEDMCAPTLC